uniref:Uncharacterized protein n=1 Tax=viral metagenome TaxID=1070528 RepID=A0A6M3JAD9_9ZZZZ
MKTEATLSNVAAKLTTSGGTALVLTLTVKHGPKVNADRLLTLIGQTLDMDLKPKQVSLAFGKDAKKSKAATKKPGGKKPTGAKKQPLPQVGMRIPKGWAKADAGKTTATE